jgi:MFS family permease
VLAVRGMPSLYLVGVLARLPHVGGGLALTLYVVEGLDRGYFEAGLVTAALTVGIALGSPWRGRLVDRVGLRRALVPSIAAMPVLWTAAAFSPYQVLLPVALLAGLMAVPVFTVLRQAIGVIVPEHSRRAGFALDSVLVEASFVAGPPMVVVAVTQVGPEVALVAIGIGEAVAGVILAWLNPRLRDHPAAGSPAAPAAPTAPAAPAAPATPTAATTARATTASRPLLGAVPAPAVSRCPGG